MGNPVGRRGYWLALVVFGCLSGGALAGPWDKLLTLNRIEADPNKEYRVTEKNGPWMILACSFSAGEDEHSRQSARQQARELVLELRKRYKLPAYTYEKKFEFGKDVPGRGVDRFGQPVRMRYQRGAETEEIAVLVGDYPRPDDPEAQETLKKLKYFQPDCLSIEKRGATWRTLAGWRMIQAAVLPEGNAKKKKGPMGHAFITTNPLLPPEFFNPRGVDPLVLKANEGVEHCLLDCPGRYSLQVAHFTGKWTLKPREIEAVEKGKPMESQLVEAAEKAHRMVVALRKRGYEAYEFHDRYASVVTVGSFDSPGQRDEMGRLRLDPQIQALMAKFQGGQRQLAGGMVINAPKTLRDLVPEVSNEDNIPFDMQPVLVEVPRRSAGALVSRPALDLRF